jgi:hypothetical protein
MPRRKNPFPSFRARMEGLIPRVDQETAVSERDQVFLDWYLQNDGNNRFGLAKGIITSMLMGEFGERVQTAVKQGNTEEALEAALDLIGDFVVDI